VTDSHSERTLAWDAEGLWRRLSPLLPDLSVEVLAKTDSTNNQILQRLRGASGGGTTPDGTRLPGRRASDTQPCLLVAEQQTAGRGRMGRAWQSGAGASLTFTLSLPLNPPSWSGLSLAVGVSLAESLDPLAGPDTSPRVRLKWPNDLWFEERKLGGVLIETLTVGDQRMVVIGIGINVQSMELGAVSTGYASVSEFDPMATVPGVLHRIAMPLVVALRVFERDGFASFRERYEQRDVLLGRQVRGGAIEGQALGVDDSGALLVQTPDGLQPIVSHEVSVRTSPWDQTTMSGPPC
jgi:BirA family biotin operon repressor/biotin-[acetyl-CoA-carboxylase] ligase